MANVAISGLPEQTGKTDNDVLAIVDSGETTGNGADENATGDSEGLRPTGV